MARPDSIAKVRNALIVFSLLVWGSCVTVQNSKDTKQAEIQYDLGVNDLRAGKLKDALHYFLESAKLNPDFPQLQNALGLNYYMLGNHEKALEHFDKALELKPKYSEVFNNKARVYIDQGRFRQALPLLRMALDDVFLPERYLAESNLGWVLFQTGERAAGYRHVKNSIAQNEKYCVGYQYLGLMLQTEKKYEEAIKEFRKVNELCPGYPQGNRDLGKALLMVGDEVAGCKTLKVCLEHSRMSEIGQECERLFKMSCAGLESVKKTENGG